MDDADKLVETLKSHKRNERHRNLAETLYWCDQYRLLAEQAIAALAPQQRALHDLAEADKAAGLDYAGASAEPFREQLAEDRAARDAWPQHMKDNARIDTATMPQPSAEPVGGRFVSTEALSKITRSLDGVSRSGFGGGYAVGWNAAIRQAMDYAALQPSAEPVAAEVLREAAEFWATYSSFNEGTQNDMADECAAMLGRMRAAAAMADGGER